MPANALVMVVDDNAKIRRLVKAVLSRAGYDVVEAADGEEALDLLDHTPPDLIVMDVVMPKMDGRRLAEEVRRRDATLPLIVVTGLESADNAVEMMRNGVYDFIAKPFTASTPVSFLTSSCTCSTVPAFSRCHGSSRSPAHSRLVITA